MPTPMRAANRAQKLLARPQATVITLQTTMPQKMIQRRLPRSASRARGTPMTV